jgi:DNA-binding MarR family transcriptional regulator
MNDVMELDLHLAAALRRAVTHLIRRLRAESSDSGLSTNKLGVLGHLHRCPEATPGDLATAEHLKPQSLSKLLAELEADGFLEREKSPRDQRRSLLRLTPEGRDTMLRAVRARDRWLAEALRGLGRTEVDVLRIAARILVQVADGEAGGSRGPSPDPRG